MSMILILQEIPSTVAATPKSEPTETPALRLVSEDPFAQFGDSDYDDDLEEFPDFDEEDGLSLEKAWHGLHFLLCGESWSGQGTGAFLLCGGTEQGEDMGYGPARVFSPEEVQAVHKHLTEITWEQLWSRFDASRMEAMDVYPGIWDEPEEDLAEEYQDYFEEMKVFVAEIAKEEHGMQIVMV